MALNAERNRSKQIIASILVILSLCVSIVAACACTHHHPEPAAEQLTSSCHEKPSAVEDVHDAHHEVGSDARNRSDTGASTDHLPPPAAADSSCECFAQSPPNAFVKQETVKIEKQTLTICETVSASSLAVAVSADQTETAYQFIIYTDQPFLNLTRGRAPPRL